ncbi:MAG: GntR family transcriptional regulator [Victivallales bacterium]|nr:GntR family transcriptional regulator [Victivallales bacterium]
MALAKNKRISSSQVALILENEIAKGRRLPGERLKSTRLLANDYGVGQRVIISALDILQRKKLVYRKERYGVYVNHPSRTPDVKEVMILSFGGTPLDQAYVRMISEFMYSPEVGEKYDFFVRYIPGRDANQRFQAEIERLEKFGYPDCVLIVGLYFTRKEVEQVLQLSYPALFLGHFLEEDYPDLTYNRLGGDCFTPMKTCLEYAMRKNYRTVRFFTDRYYQDRAVFQRVLAEAASFSNDHNMCFSHQPVGDRDEDLPELFSSALATDKKDGKLAELVVISGGNPAALLHELKVKGVDSHHDFDLIFLDTQHTSFCEYKYVKRNINKFYHEMNNAIDTICSGKNVSYGIKDIDLTSGITGE